MRPRQHKQVMIALLVADRETRPSYKNDSPLHGYRQPQERYLVSKPPARRLWLTLFRGCRVAASRTWGSMKRVAGEVGCTSQTVRSVRQTDRLRCRPCYGCTGCGATHNPCFPLTYWRLALLRWTWIRMWGIGSPLRNLVFAKGSMRLRDHFLPHASFHRSWSRLPGDIRSHLPLAELRSSNVPFAILPE